MKLEILQMKNETFKIALAFATVMLATPVLAQSTTGADPACITKNADGVEAIDMAKCPDGKTVAATPTQQAPETTGAITPAPGVFVPAESFSKAKLMSASDLIGKRVYSKAGDDLGEVNDLIVSDNGGVQAVVLGVGGFLGIGEKDVAVTMAAIEATQDGDTVRLVVDASKEQFTAAPTYNRQTRMYQ
jgi:sporulation protein YlmC with PRC-barrel domain